VCAFFNLHVAQTACTSTVSLLCDGFKGEGFCEIGREGGEGIIKFYCRKDSMKEEGRRKKQEGTSRGGLALRATEGVRTCMRW